jgi:SanA protein
VVLGVLLVVIVLAAVATYITVTVSPHIYSAGTTPPKTQVALVPGASVTSNGTLSPVLKERADKAAALYEAGIVSKILVTGDNATLEYDEVYPVGKYLLALGIPEQDIFLDYAGFDTYSSMYRARDVFKVKDVLIVSQRYHLGRAVFVARALGLDAEGVDASQGEKYFFYSLREIPASLKAVWDVLTHRVPQYLGRPFPISGEGNATWVGSTQMIYFKK